MVETQRRKAGEDGRTTLRELIGRNLKEGRSFEEELAVLASLPEAKRLVVAERLAVIDALRGSPRSMVDVRAAAEAVGTGVRNIYRLIERMEKVGPVGGLAPGFRNVELRPGQQSNLGFFVDRWLAAKLRLEPNAPVAAVIAHARARLVRARHLGRVTKDFRMPASSTLHRRVHALRPAASARARADAAFGAELVLDQVALDAELRLGTRVVPAVATFLLDRRTGLIGGVGLSVEDDAGMGLEQALHDALTERLPALAREGVPFAPKLASMTWIVPRGLEDDADDARERMRAHGIDGRVRDGGPRRHGREVVRILGDRLGRFAFRTRSTDDARAGPTTASPTRPEPARREAFRPPDMLVALRYETDRWNARRMITAPTAPAVRARIHTSSERARALSLELAELLDPVFAGIARSQEAEGGRPVQRIALADSLPPRESGDRRG